MAELSRAIARLMQERERAQEPAAASNDAPALREVLAAVRVQVPPGDRRLAEAFTRQFFDRAGAELLAAEPVEALVARTVLALGVVLERRSEEPRIALHEAPLEGGWPANGALVQTLLRDRPFIVDTIRECLHEAGCSARRLFHPILTVERDAHGAVRAFGGAATARSAATGRGESLVQIEIERVADPDGLVRLLTQRLADLVLATDDYQAMRARMAQLADQLRTPPLPPPWNADAGEVAAFLDWLADDHFIFLGYREYQLSGQGGDRTAALRRGSGLGILRKEDRSSVLAARPLPDDLRRRLNEPPLLIVSKTNAESPIHRRAHMDYFGVKEVDAAGVVIGERRFLGLLTSRAAAEEAAALPLLRRKLAAIVAAEEAVEGSHDFKAIVAAFNGLPKVALLACAADELRTEIAAVRAAEEEAASADAGVRVLCRADALGRGVFVTVMVQRERFSEDLYRRVGVRLETALEATALLDQHLVLEDGPLVRLHFYFAAPAALAAPARAAALREQVGSLLRTWEDRLHDELYTQFPREQARQLAERYGAAFAPAYKAATDVPLAVRDIRCLEALRATRTPQVDLSNDGRGGETRCTALTLYLSGEDLVLSAFLPVLEHLGLTVFSEDSLDVTVPDVGRVRLHTFYVQDGAGARLDLDDAGARLQPAVLLLHAGRIESDALNALILSAGLDWRQVELVRTYVNHGVQIGSGASRAALIRALVQAPQSARLLWEYFAVKFDPLRPAAPPERAARALPGIEQRFLESLDAVQSVADDRALRALFGAVAATVRTTFFAAGAAAGAIAVKLQSARIPHLPRPYPLCEVYVHAPHVEGIHLRGARVARGGIRLSDRPDDFRTEIFDLMKTQTVKNAVIVPAGAKGGFVVKCRPGQRATPAQITAAYRTFIGALLDLTDNIVRGRVTPPPAMVLYDDADPYLVVAADKGTATFSDVANELAAERQFWLEDAFASGGTHGYDHKKEGITARGAWECVQRHFREMGRDPEREALTVIGIGDMSGDVFGNGLLLSRAFRLLAAFNHQHIFLDPDPDPARAYGERERLFRLPRSSWADYDAGVLSAGGGVFARAAKTIPLSAAARALLGLDAPAPSGEEVIRAILRLEADLLWNGGIGTYVKASDELHAAVGDGANDAVRVDAAELRVKVVAEGGNLGFTQRARVEYALRGGRIDTDAIDNSGGVDMSDHEVNLKIALAAPLERGQLSPAERNALLADLTPDVTRRVLTHNRRQARALSLDQVRSRTRLNDFRDLMTQLEAEGLLDRHLEALPDRESLRNRRGSFLGLTRPELAVLLAHSKLALQQHLLASPLPDDALLERALHAYFPETVTARFGQAVRGHPLRREIIAVEVANALADDMGMAFVVRVSRDTGADAAAVVRAWVVAVAVSGADRLWAELGTAAPPLPPAAEERCWFAMETALERATKWIIENQAGADAAGELHDALGVPTTDLLEGLPALLPPAGQQTLAAAVEALAAAGVPRLLAQRVAALDRLAELLEIAHIARQLEVPHADAAAAYHRVGDIVDLDWVWQNLAALPAQDRWERRAIEGLTEGLVYARRQLTGNILLCHAAGGDLDTCLRDYAAAHTAQLSRLRGLIDDIKSARGPTLAALLVVMRELGRLATLSVPAAAGDGTGT